MRTFNPEQDHIDPMWRKGRDYQLVCGFEKDPKNLQKRDAIFNTIKSNRFLPWRWCQDEIGVIPCNPGDLAYFLVGANIEKDIPGEWVLMEFLSDEWFEATRHTGGSYQGGKTAGAQNVVYLQKYYEENPEKRLEHSLLGAEVTRRIYAENPDEPRRRALLGVDASKQWREDNPEKVIALATSGGRESTRRRYRCLITGYESTGQWVTIHQRKLGIDPTPENRIRIN